MLLECMISDLEDMALFLPQKLLQTLTCLHNGVIFVNENGEKLENNNFVNETKTKKLKTKMQKQQNSTKVLAYNTVLTGATAVRRWIRD